MISYKFNIGTVVVRNKNPLRLSHGDIFDHLLIISRRERVYGVIELTDPRYAGNLCSYEQEYIEKHYDVAE